MSRALRLTKWLAPLAALFALACALFAPAEAGVARRTPPQNARAPREERPPEPEESVVRGRVVYDDTTRPVRRARVMLIKENNVGRSEYAALTGAGGDFAIRGVRAGTYYAFVDVPGVLSPVGFVSLEMLRASPGTFDLGEGRRFFDLVEVDGKQDVNVTVHARRGASIAGRVTHADGDPAVNVSVSLLRRSSDGRVQRYLPGSTAAALSGLRTDDRGMYRLTGLPPGEYLIGVNEAVNHGSPAVGARSVGEDLSGLFRGMFTPQLLMTFYPSATSLKEAGVIKVGPGDERGDADVRIPERDLRVVGGVVRARRGGRPVRLAGVTIKRRDDPLAADVPLVHYYEGSEYGPNSTTTDDEGRWWLSEIPDGSYTITVRPPEEYEETPAVASVNMNSSVANANAVAGVTNTNTSEYRPPRRKRSYAPTRVNLEVSGGDVTEFVVEVAEGARVNGTVTVEGGEPPRWGGVTMLRVGEAGAAPDNAGLQSGSIEGGRFAVEGLPAGRYVFHPSVSDTEGTYLKSITWNGRDLLREPLELAEGVSVEGVRIVYGRNSATLDVTVRAAGRREPSGLFVVLLPLDLSTWSPLAQSVSCVTNEAGACSMSSPPGEYRVLAMRTPTRPDAYEQEVRRRAANAPRVSLREGEAGRVELDAPDN
ncbi:MAG TPA: carboxypeptidase-like regulatory domain-containing protein [Pyrinomonadaceae bacterium]|nr:carboxypeptidase-like regulatory domain-containing protein [Pyrinomonadaceae bacterium]